MLKFNFGEKVEVCERADITDLLCIDSGGFNIQVSMFEKAFESTTFFVAAHLS